MYRFMSANKSDGMDSKILSFIFILTTNPENIRSDKPPDAIKARSGMKKKPSNSPIPPNNCK